MLPAGHTVQVLDPSIEKEPFAQAVAAEPGEIWVDPALTFTVLMSKKLVQSSPTAHWVTVPEGSQRKPAGQLEQVVPPLFENCPVPQGTGGTVGSLH